jgi:hypothetical protein
VSIPVMLDGSRRLEFVAHFRFPDTLQHTYRLAYRFCQEHQVRDPTPPNHQGIGLIDCYGTI